MHLGLVIGTGLEKAVEVLSQKYKIEFVPKYADFCEKKKNLTNGDTVWLIIKNGPEKTSYWTKE